MTGQGQPPAASGPVWPPFVLLGIGAGCISALQPLLLDLLRQSGKLDVAAMGLAATAEAAGMAIATTLAALRLPLAGLRTKALLALAAMVLANAGTVFAGAEAVVVLRFVNGAGSGILLWLLVGMLSRSDAPARIFAIYVTAQSVLALALSQAIAALVAPAFGHAGAYGLLVLLNLAMLVAVPRLADGFAGADAGSMGLPGPRALLVLLAMAAFLAGIMGLWVYLLPLLAASGHDAATAGMAVPVGIAGQIAGGLLAVFLASRLGAVTAWVCGIVLALAAIVLLVGAAGTLPMLLGAGLFGLVWIFVPPFQMPAVLGVDPTGRGAMLVGTAQLSGTVIGPLAAAPLVARLGVSAVSGLAAAWLALSLLMLMAARFGHRTFERTSS